MLHSNTMRFGTDNFEFIPRGMISAKTPLDASSFSEVRSFTVEGAQPYGSVRKAVFKVDDQIVYFPTVTSEGSAVPVTFPYEPTIDNVLNYGTPADDLARIDGISAWIGKLIYPIIALKSTANNNGLLPTIKLGLTGVASADVFTHTVETAEFSFLGDDTTTIIDIVADSTTTETASIAIKANIKRNDTWINTDYNLEELQYVQADAIKFKITYTVARLNEDSAKLNSLIIRYKVGNTTAVANAAVEIVSVTQDYDNELRFAQISVKHKKLEDSVIKAFVTFKNTPKSRDMYDLAIGTGEEVTYDLKPADQDELDSRIDQSTLKVFIDGIPRANFNFNTETSQITLTVPLGSVLSVSYDYDLDSEDWQQMTHTTTQIYQNSEWYNSRYEYALPDEQNGKTSAVFKFVLERNEGTVTNADYGTANGVPQTFVLPHKAKADTISIPNAQFTYNEDSRILTVVAPLGTALKLTYDWVGGNHEIDSFVAGLSVLDLSA